MTVVVDQPLKNALEKHNASERLVKWVIELSLYRIEFDALCSIKAHALAVFRPENTNMDVQHSPSENAWSLYVDGSLTKDGSRAELIIDTL